MTRKGHVKITPPIEQHSSSSTASQRLHPYGFPSINIKTPSSIGDESSGRESSIQSSPSGSSISSAVSPRSAPKHPHHNTPAISDLKSTMKSPQPSLAQLVQLSHDSTAGGPTPFDQQHKPLLVLKVGTSTIMETSTASFCLSNLGTFVDCICNIKEQGYQVVLVSSGAVGAGIIHMKLKERPTTLPGKQAASAVGQCRMMRLYEDLFAIREQKVGQLILTRTDLMDRTRFINFKQTLKELLRLGVVPIINENDSIATAQLRFGDNDTLAAYVAVSLGAQWLFLLTDVDCLYTSNPRIHHQAKPIPYVSHLDDVYKLLDEKENTGTTWGSGGMRTKIVAAKIATATGIHTALCHGKHPERVLDVIAFAEAHGQTPAEWESELTRWRRNSYKDSQAKMRSSRSEASFERNRPVTVPGLSHNVSCADFRGLQHHHSHYSVALVPSADVNKAMSECGAESVSSSENTSLCVSGEGGPSTVIADGAPANQSGLVTVDSLEEMPYLATIFAAQECTQSIRDQRRWILSLPVRGRIHIDQGAAHAIIEGKKSLFAAGITRVEGMFYENEAAALVLDRSTLTSPYPSTVSLGGGATASEHSISPESTLRSIEAAASTTAATSIVGANAVEKIHQQKHTITATSITASSMSHSHHLGHGHGHTHHGGSHQHRHHPHSKAEPSLFSVLVGPTTEPVEAPENEGELARCLVNFSSIELEKIKGLRSNKFRDVLGYECDPEVAHRQNIIFVNPCAVYGCSSQSTCCNHLTPTSSTPQSPYLRPH